MLHNKVTLFCGMLCNNFAIENTMRVWQTSTPLIVSPIPLYSKNLTPEWFFEIVKAPCRLQRTIGSKDSRSSRGLLKIQGLDCWKQITFSIEKVSRVPDVAQSCIKYRNDFVVTFYYDFMNLSFKIYSRSYVRCFKLFLIYVKHQKRFNDSILVWLEHFHRLSPCSRIIAKKKCYDSTDPGRGVVN